MILFDGIRLIFSDSFASASQTDHTEQGPRPGQAKKGKKAPVEKDLSTATW